jgi:RNA polymerase sigma-70 factor (ECF subfamily)
VTATEFSNQLDTYENFLFNFANQLTQNREKAKDLKQDTVLRAYRYRDKFQPGTNFRAWIGTIMRNTFINQFRKAKRRRVVSEPVENLAYAIESQNIVPNQGEANLRIQEIQEKIEFLKDKYRVPFLMHFQGYEYKEIADHFDIPIGTVKSRLFVARKQLKEMLFAN